MENNSQVNVGVDHFDPQILKVAATVFLLLKKISMVFCILI